MPNIRWPRRPRIANPIMKFTVAIILAALLATAAARALIAHDDAREHPASAVRHFTGAHTRLVWTSQTSGDGRDVMARGTELTLMGLDTDDRRGIRPLLPQQGSYGKPMLSPRGNRVVFTDWSTHTIQAVTWDGTSLATLATNATAVAVWLDPAQNTEWVYALATDALKDRDAGRPLFRFALDTPSRRETVWEETDITLDNIMLSRDGRTLGALFPWPHAGLANLDTKTWSILGRGCWPSLSPDDARLLWIFDGAHRNVVMHTPDNAHSWTVNINNAPGIDGYEVYHPRWANHVRFLAMTGPYKSGAGDNLIRAGGPGVEIHLGRFSPDLRSVEAWLPITSNTVADFYPDVWINPAANLPGASSNIFANATPPTTPQPTSQRILLDARLTTLTPTPSAAAIAPYRNALVVHHYEVLNVITGHLESTTVRVAHWGLRNAQPLPFTTRRGDTRRLTLEPFDLHPELEGERLIMGTAPQTSPLYYDMESR